MKRKRLSRVVAAFAAVMAGGALFGTCQTRIHDSVMNGMQLFILDLLDPSNLILTPEA